MQFSAKTKNEAITKACIELGVSSDQLDIQVVSEGSSGFFGIGSKPAIIKARKVYDNSEEKEIEKIVDSVKINAFKEDTVKETQKSAPKSVSRQNDVKPETKTETAKASKEEKQPRPAKEKPAKEKPVKEQKERPAKEKQVKHQNRSKSLQIRKKSKILKREHLYSFAMYLVPWILEKFRSLQNTIQQTVVWKLILKEKIWASLSVREDRHWILSSI